MTSLKRSIFLHGKGLRTSRIAVGEGIKGLRRKKANEGF